MSAPDFDLIVVRHGRTAWNAGGRFQGGTDVPLDDVGRAQAEALARRLEHERIDAILTSDLVRARETAEIIARPHGLVPRVDVRFRELNFGAWEGLTWAEIVERFPDAARPRAGGAFATPQGGESFGEACLRVNEALTGVRASATPGARIVVATHAGVLHALLRVALEASEAEALRVRFVPASVTRLRFAPSGPATIVSLNETVPVEEAAKP